MYTSQITATHLFNTPHTRLNLAVFHFINMKKQIAQGYEYSSN